MRIRSTILAVFYMATAIFSGAVLAGPIGMVVDNTRKVHVLDASSDVVLATLNLINSSTSGDCSITADGTRGFATTFTGILNVIDLTNPALPSVLTTPSISNWGEDTSISSDQKYVVVSDGGAYEPLSVVDIATQSEISTFSVDIYHNAVEVLSDGSVLSANYSNGKVYKLSIDAAGALSNTGQVLAGVGNVMNVYGDPTATAGFTVQLSSSSITSFLLSGMTAVDSRALPGPGNAGAMHPSGDKIYARTTNGHVVAYSFVSSTGALGASPLFDVSVANSNSFYGMDQLAVTPDGSKLYVPSGNTVLVLDPANGSVLKTITNASFGSLTGVCFAPQVDDEPPVTGNVLATPNPVAINTILSLTANVDDTDTGESTVISADYNVDGGAWSTMNAADSAFGEVSEDVEASFYAPTEAGIYDVCVRGTDGSGNTSAVGTGAECILLVVYDPTGGFVTGGGWIDSTGGAYIPDPLVSGKATFGFVSKYKKGATTPTGDTEFQFKAGDLNFHSTSYDFLVITNGGTDAQFKGPGTINGERAPNGSEYEFMIWAQDNGNADDTFRIKIWYDDGGVEIPVYDNGFDQTIGGGSIVVHTDK